jgi:hypothetical protein
MVRPTLTDREIIAQLPGARRAARLASHIEPCAAAARYDRGSRRIEVQLTNGCSFAFPADLARGLRGASANDLADVEIELDGAGLHWERLDEDLLVAELVHAVFGSKRWMSEIGRTLGSVRSPAKARAARINGQKGGRPRKR